MRCFRVAGAAGDSERAARLEDTGDVGQGGRRVGHEVDGVRGECSIDAHVGERDRDAVAVTQIRSTVTASHPVAGGRLFHHGRRGIDAEHPVAVADQQCDGAALPETNVEHGARFAQIERIDGPLVRAGCRADHRSPDHPAEQPGREPGLPRPETAHDPGPGRHGSGHRPAPIRRSRTIAAHWPEVSAGYGRGARSHGIFTAHVVTSSTIVRARTSPFTLEVTCFDRSRR